MTNMLEGSNLYETLGEYNQQLFDKWVANVEFHFMGLKTTACLLTVSNGFEIVGTSACVDPVNFNEAVGKQFALIDALNKMDSFIGFALQSGIEPSQ